MKYEFCRQDAFDFANFIGIETRIRGENLNFRKCPYCESTKDQYTFAINLLDGTFCCLRASCSAKGNMTTLARDFKFVPNGQQNSDDFKPKKAYRTWAAPKEPIKPRPQAIVYLESRGISREIAEKYEITTVRDKDNILVFSFCNPSGDICFIKYRKTDFQKGIDKNKEWCEKDGMPILFGMKQCEDFTRLIMTEGQIDQLSLAEAGIKNTVSVPTGAKGMTWIPHCYDWVNSFEEIVIFGDCEKGHITLVDDIKKRFALKKIRVVRIADYLGCKDANEMLQKYGKEALVNAVENAQLLPVKRLKLLKDVTRKDVSEIPRLATGIRRLDYALNGGLFLGQIVIIAGRMGKGKSTFAGQLIARAIDQGFNCMAYSGEMADYDFKRWIDFQVAGSDNIMENVKYGIAHRFLTRSVEEEIDAWYADHVSVYDQNIIDDEPEDLPKTITEAILKQNVEVILLDNLMTGIDISGLEGTRANEFEKQTRFLQTLRKIVLKYNVLIILVAHKKKEMSESVLEINNEIAGSSNVANIGGTILHYDMDKDLQDNQRKLRLTKNRFGDGKLIFDGLTMNYDEKSKRIYCDKVELYHKYGWETKKRDEQQLEMQNDYVEIPDEEEVPFE